MDDTLLLKIAVVVFGLMLFGIVLTIYEFREHIIEQHKKRKAKRRARKAQ